MAKGALKAIGFQNIQKRAGPHFRGHNAFRYTAQAQAMIMIFGDSDAAKLSMVNAVRTKIA
jgi:hypothetical protein